MNSVETILGELLRPGETLILSGRRGHGKTATGISIAQRALRGEYGHKKVAVITNVVFGRVPPKGGKPYEAYPPGIHHEDTLAGTLRKAGEIIREHGPGGCTILWLLDEAQNYMMADENAKKENLALTKYLGNARKFGICNIFMTPTINNLTPRVRCFPTGESKSGYCSAQMLKDKNKAYPYIRGPTDPRSVTFLRDDPDMEWVPAFIEPTPWIRSIYGDVEPGGYGYDTLSMAMFEVGSNANGVPFSLEDFLKATSKGLSGDLPDKIEEFFENWDKAGSEGPAGREKGEVQMLRVGRMREDGVTWRKIGEYEDVNESTIKDRYNTWIKRRTSSAGCARDTTADDGQHPADTYVYNLERGGDEGAPAAGGGMET